MTQSGKMDFGVEKEDKKPFNRPAPRQAFFERFLPSSFHFFLLPFTFAVKITVNFTG